MVIPKTHRSGISALKSMHDKDFLDRDSSKHSDDNKSVRSKKSYVSVAKSITKVMRGTNTTKNGSIAGRDSKTKKKHVKEKIPQAEKLNMPERKVHKDDLDEQHFQEARNFLNKKQRSEYITAKLAEKRGGKGGGFKKMTNDDVGHLGLGNMMDREILADSVMTTYSKRNVP